MISHRDLHRFAMRGTEMLNEGPGVGGRIEPACFATETHRMADTYLRVSGENFAVDAELAALPDDARKAIMDAIERAFSSGVAIGLAHHEEQELRHADVLGMVSLPDGVTEVHFAERPWRVVGDWTYEVHTDGGTIVAKCERPETAEAIKQIQGEPR